MQGWIEDELQTAMEDVEGLVYELATIVLWGTDPFDEPVLTPSHFL